jgi:mRNA interferase MazF
MICVPVTNQAKGYPFEVALHGTGTSGVALADQVKCLDWSARRVERKGRVSAKELDRIRLLLKALLQIN